MSEIVQNRVEYELLGNSFSSYNEDKKKSVALCAALRLIEADLSSPNNATTMQDHVNQLDDYVKKILSTLSNES